MLKEHNMKNQRVIGYDIIRIIASVMVVAIHSNVFYLSPPDGSLNWLIIMELTALCVIAVPLFFMVSGAGNLVREDVISIKQLYREKIPKQFVPFLLWSVIYVVIRMAMGKIPVSADNFISLIWEPAYYQFWFMYTLFGLYLLIPVFQFLLQRADQKILQYILIFWIAGSVILPLAVRYIPGFRLSGHFDILFLEGYWGYFLLGGYLRKYPVRNSKRAGRMLFIAGIILTGVAAVIEWIFTEPQSYYGYVYSAYLFPGAVMASVGVFLFLSDVKLEEKKRKIILHLSGLSMGVYYLHTLVISGLEQFFVSWGKGVGVVVLKWMAVCILSALITEVIKKVKWLRGLLLN